jgi:hypothetical protein
MLNLLDIQYVQVTAQYSNAVLMAIIPHISQFAAKMELPVHVPIAAAEVRAFGCDRHLSETGGALALTNGYIFVFKNGHVKEFKTSAAYYDIEDLNAIPRFYGKTRITDEEAVRLCRKAIRKLGYKEAQIYADLPPKIVPPPRAGTNTIPRYLVKWVDPRDGTPSCEMEVNAQDSTIESIYFLNRNLWRKPPQNEVPATPPPGRRFTSLFQPVNPDYARALLPIIIAETDQYARKLELLQNSPIATNEVASFRCETYDGEVFGDLILTNGNRFFYRHGMLEVFDAPDCFFNFPKPGVVVSQFIGKWQMTEAEAIELARKALTKLGYSTSSFGADRRPELERPFNVGNVPRYHITWRRISNGVLLSHAIFEIDAEKKQVKSITLLNPSLWRPLPDVGIPLKIPKS